MLNAEAQKDNLQGETSSLNPLDIPLYAAAYYFQLLRHDCQRFEWFVHTARTDRNLSEHQEAKR